MSHLLKISGLLLALQLLFDTTSSACSQNFYSSGSGSDCRDDYINTIQPHMIDLAPDPKARQDVQTFRTYLGDIDLGDSTWYTFWNEQKTVWDSQKKTEIDISYCDSIIPIKNDLPDCLCQLLVVCDSLCEEYIGNIFEEHNSVYAFIVDNKIPQGVTHDDCKNVMEIIAPTYQNLCGETRIYKLIQECANGTLSPNGTPNPTISPFPTLTPTTSTTSTTSTPTFNSTAAEAPTTYSVTTTYTPTKPSTTETTINPNNTQITSDITGTDDSYNYDYYSSTNAPDTDNLDVVPSTTTSIELTAPKHPFANLLLVSLIILGFCVFVAWYAKKNQITSDGIQRRDDDNGYFLGGLNKSSSSRSPSQPRRMMSDDGDTHSNKFGKFKHQKLSQFDDEEQQMHIQMSNKNNNDLLAITPDHVGRLQTRVPNTMAPNHPITRKHTHKLHKLHHKFNKKPKHKRKGRGGKFQQLQDDDEAMDSESDSSSSGVDMMSAEMQDKFNEAHNRWIPRVADTIRDISDSVKETAQAVQIKFIKREQPVVVPMQLKSKVNKGPRGGGHVDKKKYPFTIVEDNETTDGFDYGDEDVSSCSTQENEYREDSETEVRVNIHGRKIKQPMKLPRLDHFDDVGVLQQSHGEKIKGKGKKHRKKNKKKLKKKKKGKKNKEKEIVRVQVQEVEEDMVVEDGDGDGDVKKVKVESESHDINIRMNNDDNMGFGSDELDDNIELTKEDVTMTMNDLQMELMKHNQTVVNGGKEDGNNNNNNNVDLSFMDNIGVGNENNVDEDNTNEFNVELTNGNVSKGNVVVGNETV